MGAKDTVMKERGAEYDSDCGQEICCYILPRYIKGENIELCYLEISKVVEEFAKLEREAQAEITWPIAYKAGIREVVEWIHSITAGCVIETDNTISELPVHINRKTWQAKLKEWGIE